VDRSGRIRNHNNVSFRGENQHGGVTAGPAPELHKQGTEGKSKTNGRGSKLENEKKDRYHLTKRHGKEEKRRESGKIIQENIRIDRAIDDVKGRTSRKTYY